VEEEVVGILDSVFEAICDGAVLVEAVLLGDELGRLGLKDGEFVGLVEDKVCILDGTCVGVKNGDFVG